MELKVVAAIVFGVVLHALCITMAFGIHERYVVDACTGWDTWEQELEELEENLERFIIIEPQDINVNLGV